MIDEIDGALGDGKGAVEVILKMVMIWFSVVRLLLFSWMFKGHACNGWVFSG